MRTWVLFISLALGVLASCPTVRIGSRGACVRTVQRAVGANPDGIFGRNTKAKVMAFQRRHGLSVDGIVGRNTWRAIGGQHRQSGGGSHGSNVGKAAVESAISRLSATGIFPNDHGYLKRVAWVESRFGTIFSRSNTFVKNGASTSISSVSAMHQHMFEGIWQVDPISVTDVQRRLPAAKKNAIKSQLGIDIDNINRGNGDFRDPLKNVVVARALIFLKTRRSIPTGVSAQARYWKKYYNTSAGKGTVAKFIRDVANMP